MIKLFSKLYNAIGNASLVVYRSQSTIVTLNMCRRTYTLANYNAIKLYQITKQQKHDDGSEFKHAISYSRV